MTITNKIQKLYNKLDFLQTTTGGFNTVKCTMK